MAENILYIVEDAAKIVYESIPDELRQKLTMEEILIILDIEFDYQQEIGMAGEPTIHSITIDIPFDIDIEEMKYYIIDNCVEFDIILTYEELNQILVGEEKYLEMAGLKEDETFDYGMYFN